MKQNWPDNELCRDGHEKPLGHIVAISDILLKSPQKSTLENCRGRWSFDPASYISTG
ncbi:hypothetical protein MES4922_30175 [Mesorhizobium ventifaucium]|uniref:Uncharacterized protein n=1 Tax=Mesorhizobium ventifaucium TaxID=666020 RepID=A0ABM9DXU2_9HYPH|nr:hypothetical protein MES4922_30175 [Mesorhizobium ventifaucium]